MKKTLIGIAAIILFSLIVFAVMNTSPSLPKTATIKTNHGNIVLQLHPDKTPKTVENFTTLAERGKYDDTIFHRVIKGFMIQGGDFTNRDGTGGESIWGGPFGDEISRDLSHVRGVISMANRGPNTNGSQFFITQRDVPHLDGKHTVFGQVIEGIDVVDKIADLKTDVRDRPEQDVVVETIMVE